MTWAMYLGAGSSIILIVALSLLWLAIAAAVAIASARRMRAASEVIEAARSNARLLDAMPARPLLVLPDDGIEIDARLARDLGLDGAKGLGDLGGEASGLVSDDLAALRERIEAARAS